MDKSKLAFGRINYNLLVVGVAIVVIGFILMSGGTSTKEMFNPEVFSPTRIKVAPVVTLVGYITIIASILVRPKGGEAGAEMATQSSETNVTEA